MGQQPTDEEDEDGEGLPEVPLEELLDELEQMTLEGEGLPEDVDMEE